MTIVFQKWWREASDYFRRLEAGGDRKTFRCETYIVDTPVRSELSSLSLYFVFDFDFVVT